MKTILLSLATIFTIVSANAQYSQDFEGTEASLLGNCWTMTEVHIANAGVISGAQSAQTQPLTGGSVRELITPALNVTSTSLNISFNYRLTNTLNPNSVRTIDVGLLSPGGAFTSLAAITLNSSNSTSIYNFNQTFTVSTGWRKLVIRASGTQGPGSARLMFDDLSTDASPLYGSGICNSAPVVVDDVYTVLTGQNAAGNVMINDSEPNGEAMTAAVVTTSPDGTLVLNANGSFVFTPSPTFTGSVTTFTYQLTDNGFDPVTSNTGLVTINFSASASLPVTLVAFSASLNASNEVDLKWTTSTEKNVSHFAIERSTDGQTYNQAGIVFATGNSSDLVHYNFTDKKIDANKGTIYYRLRSVDMDGTFELSSIKTVTIGAQNRGVAISTYPNPVTSQLKVTLPSKWQNKQVTFEIISNNGQVVKRSVSGSANQTETVDVNSLAPGFYILSASCNGETGLQKIIKK